MKKAKNLMLDFVRIRFLNTQHLLNWLEMYEDIVSEYDPIYFKHKKRVENVKKELRRRKVYPYYGNKTA